MKRYSVVGRWGFRPREDGFGLTVFEVNGKIFREVGTFMRQIKAGALCIDHEKNIVYVVDEVAEQPEFHGHGGGGAVYALQLHEDGTLTEINHQLSYGNLASYCCIDKEKNVLLVTNHGNQSHALKLSKDTQGVHMEIVESDSTTVLYPLAEDGAILPPADYHEHMTDRPSGETRIPHLHSVVKAPGKSLYTVCDKGADRVYLFGTDGRRLTCNAVLQGIPDSAPRYSCFHPILPVFYYNEERQTYINAVSYTDTSMERIQRVSTLPEGETLEKAFGAADLKVSADGCHLYHLLRPNNMITVYEIDEKGLLTPVQYVRFGSSEKSSEARWITLSPKEDELFICAMMDDELVCYKIGENGLLREESRRTVSAAAAACMEFAEVYE